MNKLKCMLWSIPIVICISACGNDTMQYVALEETVSTQEAESETQEAEEKPQAEETKTEEGLIYVYVCGEVAHAGVYTLSDGSRMFDLFELAGGLTENAAENYWNQASLLTDGQMVYVPTKEEAEERQQEGWDVSSNVSENANTNDTTGKINLNTASLEQLMELPGIGESKAKAILSYRETNGRFSAIEEVMNIEGIKEGVFAKMKDYIVVD